MNRAVAASRGRARWSSLMCRYVLIVMLMIAGWGTGAGCRTAGQETGTAPSARPHPESPRPSSSPEKAAAPGVTTSPGATPTTGPAPSTANAPAGADLGVLPLPSGAVVYVAGGLDPAAREVDVLVHFHGAPHIVVREVGLARLQAVVIIVNYKGLSATYEKPYSEPERFASLLAEAHEELRTRGRLASDARWRHVCLSSFSAGYGAVRALLLQPKYYEQIDGVYLADSLYAGWKDDVPYSGANPTNMAPFRRLASDAVAGRKTLLVSHSYFDPQKYAGTHVTADDLVTHVGLARRAVDEAGPADMRIVSRAEAGQFSVWGCTAPAEEHGRHLQNMHYWLAHLPISTAGATAP